MHTQVKNWKWLKIYISIKTRFNTLLILFIYDKKKDVKKKEEENTHLFL